MGLLENLEKVVEKKVEARMGPALKKMNQMMDVLVEIRDLLKKISRGGKSGKKK